MIFKYELRFVSFTIHMAECLLEGRNFVSGIHKLKPKKT